MSKALRLLAHLHRGGQFGYIWVLPGRRRWADQLPVSTFRSQES